MIAFSQSRMARLVVLISLDGDILTNFNTDRSEFPGTATYDRDRIFSLIFTGDLAALPDMNLPAGIVVEGAVYKEVEAWRIGHRTINKPHTPRRRRKTAKILPFNRKGGARG